IMGKYGDAEAPARKAVAIAERRAAEDPTTLWESYFRLGSVLMSPDSTEGLSYLDRADGVLVARFGEAHPQRIRLPGNRAGALSLRGRNEEAVALAEKMLALAGDVLSPNHRWVGILHGRLGFALMKLRHWQEALAALDHDAFITRASKDDRELGEAL